jgi:hypothetical protein
VPFAPVDNVTGVTVPPVQLAIRAVWPLGVIAIAVGLVSETDVPVAFVAVLIGVTVFEPLLSTHAV